MAANLEQLLAKVDGFAPMSAEAAATSAFAGKLTVSVSTKNGPKLILAAATKAARVIARELQGQIAFDPETGTWLIYTGVHWSVQENPSAILKLVSDMVEAGAEPLNWNLRWRTDIIETLKTQQLLPPPPPSPLIAFTNGLLDPETLTLTPATPETAPVGGYPYVFEPDADCPTITAWLTNIVGDPDTIELLRAWMAALLRRVRPQRFLFLLGRGGTGKSTFCELLTALAGAGNTVATDLATLETSRFEAARLYGKRLAVLGEVGKHGGGVNLLKGITGGDAIRLERKHQQTSASFVFTGLVVLVGNEHMLSTDQTSGLERRRITVMFGRELTAGEKLKWESLGGNARLVQELPGLARWALQMPVAEMHRRLMVLPAQVISANVSAMSANSSVAGWLLDNCTPEPNQTLQVGVRVESRNFDGRIVFDGANDRAYPNYLRWCQEQHRQPVSLRKFSDAVVDAARHLGAPVTKHRAPNPTRAAQFVGLRLNSGGWMPTVEVSVEVCGGKNDSQAIEVDGSGGNGGIFPTNFFPGEIITVAL